MNFTPEELVKAGVTKHASGVYLVKDGTRFYPINEADIPAHIERRKEMEEQIAAIELERQLLKLKKENRQIVIDNLKSIWFPSAILIVVVPILYFCLPPYFAYVRPLADKPLTLNVLVNVVFMAYCLTICIQHGLKCFFELIFNITEFKKVKKHESP